jgi:hypothetical protein
LVLRYTRLLKPLAKAADSNAGSLPDGRITVLESSLNERPDLVHKRGHELAAPFHRDTESKHCTPTMGRVCGAEELKNEIAERIENLIRRKVGSKTIDNAESRLKVCQREKRTSGRSATYS